MTDKEMDMVAHLMEQTWSNTYYKKDHKQLTTTLLTLMGECKYSTVCSIIRDYAINYDNVPTVATITKLASKPKENKVAPANPRPKYFEDSDGCGYLWNDQEKDYDCIWKYWWAEKGRSKMETLKAYGVIQY